MQPGRLCAHRGAKSLCACAAYPARSACSACLRELSGLFGVFKGQFACAFALNRVTCMLHFAFKDCTVRLGVNRMELQPKRLLISAFLGIALTLGMFAGASALAFGAVAKDPIYAYAAQAGVWKKSGTSWWYAYSRGGCAVGWQHISGKWYYFDARGWMKEGWQQVNGTWYYLAPGSGAMATGWQKVSGTWYYLSPSSGAMATGWQKVGGVWYYLKPSSGAMCSNGYL